MPTILHIDASARREGSRTRLLSRDVVELLRAREPKTRVIYHDLFFEPPEPITDNWILGAFAPPRAHTPAARAALGWSDRMIAELKEADTYVFGVPTYNFTIPAPFKAFLDQVIQPEKTFSLANGFPEGMLHGKKVYVCCASNSDYDPHGPLAAFDFHEPYLRRTLGFIGITDITYFKAIGMRRDVAEPSLEAARRAIRELLAPAGIA